MKITVLMGGASAERNVSLASGLRIVNALRSRGHEVTAFDPSRGLIDVDAERELEAKGVGTEPPSLDALANATVGAFFARAKITCGRVGYPRLPVSQIKPKPEMYEYKCKYTAGMA